MTAVDPASNLGLDELDGIDLARIRARADGLLRPPIAYVPIRHHSPTCSVYVRSIIEELRPAAVLVEGPPAFDEHIELLVDPAARMPLAIYSHATFAPAPSGSDGGGNDGGDQLLRFSSYFPLCDYSPELVALRAGREIGAELRFIDLDYDRLARFKSSVAGHTDESEYRFSHTIAAAAVRLRCRDHNELWDHMVEGRAVERDDHVAAVLAYGTLARTGTDPARIASDGTTARESAMATAIAQTASELEQAGRSEPIVVVTGAFHTVVLPELVAELGSSQPPSRTQPPNASRGAGNGTGPRVGQPPVGTAPGPVAGELLDSGHGLIRYSFDRLDALAGYSAGMPSPRWYQTLWEYLEADRGETVEPSHALIEEVAAALRTSNGDGQPSVPSVVDALVATERLRLLRGRSTPTRLDALDAMVSCFTKGEDSITSPVRIEAARYMTGFELGAVPPKTPRVPLARDVDRLLVANGLDTESTEPRQLNLDVYRSERDRRRSRFLHGLDAIGVQFGRCITPLRYSRAGGRDVIRERWTVQLTGATDASITEASVWGAGVEEAVAAKTLHEFDQLVAAQPSAAELMRMVMAAATRGVPAVVAAALEQLRQRIAVDPSLAAVVAALSEAELLWKAREPLGGSSLEALPALSAQLFARACQLGGRLHEAPFDRHRELVENVQVLHRIVATDAWPDLDAELFWAMLADQRDRVAPGVLRGAIGGLQWRGGRCPDAELLALTIGHIGAGSDHAIGPPFLTGLILVACESLWEVDGLVGAISDVLRSFGQEEFLRRVPGLRSAFASLTPRQTDRLAEVVAATTGANGATPAINARTVGIGETDVLRHSLVSAAAVDQLKADGLGSWLASGTQP